MRVRAHDRVDVYALRLTPDPKPNLTLAPSVGIWKTVTTLRMPAYKEVMLDLKRQEIGDVCQCRIPDNVLGMFRADIDALKYTIYYQAVEQYKTQLTKYNNIEQNSRLTD